MELGRGAKKNSIKEYDELELDDPAGFYSTFLSSMTTKKKGSNIRDVVKRSACSTHTEL